MFDYMIIFVVLLALAFDFINGFHDTATAIATSVSTRALTPTAAVWLAATLNLIGALYSTNVALTIGGGIVQSQLISQYTVVAALLSAIFWNLVTWWFGIPSSSSHALIGGLVGAAITSAGFSAIKVYGLLNIVASLIVSPVVAFCCGFLTMMLFLKIFGKMSPVKLNPRFRHLQICSAAMTSFSHGSNDAQKAMGIITLALLSSGYISVLEVPIWVKFSAAAAMSLGTAFGGWRIIRTMGSRIFKLEPMSGFASDINSSIVIFGATLLHMPVSTTHVVSSSIMGVGSTKRFSAVRWGVAKQIVTAWFLTIPSTAIVGGIFYELINYIRPLLQL